MVCVLIVYCCVRRKIARCTDVSTTNVNVSKSAISNAIELAALHRALPSA